MLRPPLNCLCLSGELYPVETDVRLCEELETGREVGGCCLRFLGWLGWRAALHASCDKWRQAAAPCSATLLAAVAGEQHRERLLLLCLLPCRRLRWTWRRMCSQT